MDAEALKELVINALEDLKAQDIAIIDVTDRTSVTDFMVLATGTSSRHAQPKRAFLCPQQSFEFS